MSINVFLHLQQYGNLTWADGNPVTYRNWQLSDAVLSLVKCRMCCHDGCIDKMSALDYSFRLSNYHRISEKESTHAKQKCSAMVFLIHGTYLVWLNISCTVQYALSMFVCEATDHNGGLKAHASRGGRISSFHPTLYCPRPWMLVGGICVHMFVNLNLLTEYENAANICIGFDGDAMDMTENDIRQSKRRGKSRHFIVTSIRTTHTTFNKAQHCIRGLPVSVNHGITVCPC